MSGEAIAVEWALELDGNGKARKLTEDELAGESGGKGLWWVHLDYEKPGAEAWLQEQSAIPELYQESLTSDSPRPRILTHGEDLLVVLRGINHNPGSEPEDMVALRMWLGAHRLVTLRHRKLRSLVALREALETGKGPWDPGSFLIAVLDSMVENISESVESLVDRVDQLEDQTVDEGSQELRSEVAALRREAIALRRYLAPQRDALSRLSGERLPWLSQPDRAYIREIGDRLVRVVEDLDSARDRATVVQDHVASAMGEQLNRTMYLFSVITAVFLPLGLLTGLLGINVGGMPGVDDPRAFSIVTLLLVVLAILLLLLLRRYRFL